VLVDEAHNLVERGRQMYSATLDQGIFNSVRKTAPEALKKALQRVNREWNALHNAQLAPYQAYDKVPEKLLQAITSCSASIGDYLNDHPQGLDSGLQNAWFEMLQFGRVAELFDAHYLFDISKRDLDRKRPLSQLCLRNVVPAALLGPRLKAARSSVLFSATLSPRHYYADLLGTPADTVWIDVESPFSAEQLQVRIVSQISTRFTHRQASLEPIVELIALPENVHGPRDLLPSPELKPADRAAKRTQNWVKFTDEVRAYMDRNPQHPVSGVIVMADLWYQSSTGAARKDDKINKRVGRVAINRELGLMVQYLLPRERLKGQGVNPKKLRGFQIRTINAWRDLAWKSIGKMNGLSEKITASFAEPPADPAALTLLGVGIIRVNRKRWSGNTTSFIPYAIELDPITGTCRGSLMLGQGDGEAKPSPDAASA